MKYREVLLLLKESKCWTFYAGDYTKYSSPAIDIYMDDFAKDERIVYRFKIKTGNCTATYLSGYNESKKSWTISGREERFVIETKHGLNNVLSYIEEISLKLTGYPKSQWVHFYANDKRLKD